MFKKNDIVRATSDGKSIKKGQIGKVVRGGKTIKVHTNFDPKTGRVIEWTLPSSIAPKHIEKVDFKSRCAIINELDMSKVKHHAAMSEETLALTGYVTYKGEKIFIKNEGFGGCSNTFCETPGIVEEVDKRIRDEVLAVAPKAESFMLDLEQVVNWSIDVKGLCDYPEYAARV